VKEDKKYKKRVPAKAYEDWKIPRKADDVYQPKLAWFKWADIFLKNVVSNRTTTSNLVSTFVLLHNFSYFYYIHINGKLLTLVLIIEDYIGLH